MKRASTGEKWGELLLSPLRVLDLTDEKGFLCGRILADLGADVIKIESPVQDGGRRIGPFYHNNPHPEKSLYWFVYNANKRGITLNIETGDGIDIFKQMVKKADIVLESFPLGYMDSLGLDYANLSRINPRIIVTSITPFGQKGPYSTYKASELVTEAIGGIVYSTGDTDRSPVSISFPQAYLVGGSQAAAASLLAYWHCRASGEGQQVDVSMQESLNVVASISLPHWPVRKHIISRHGQRRGGTAAHADPRILWPCKDGYVCFELMGTPTGLKTCQKLAQWMIGEGEAGILEDVNWDKFDRTKVTQEIQDSYEEPVFKFFLKRTKAKLYKEAQERGMLLYPVRSMGDIVADDQLRARDFFVDIEHPELGTSITYPKGFLRTSAGDGGIRRRAPLKGEHNMEIYHNGMGFTMEQLTTLKSVGVI
ncbi:CaiB/BaiF CoA transferase family protein [Chloroflexota bacterium]